MKKFIATIALVAAAGLSANAASAEVGVYPGGLPTATSGPSTVPGGWYGRGRWVEPGPADIPAYRNAQEAAFAGAFFPGSRGSGDRILRADDEVLLRSDDRIVREIR